MLSYSRIWDKVYFGDAVLMLDIVLLVESVEVLWESLCHNWLNLWLTCLGPNRQFKWLVYLLIGCFKLKLLRLVMRYSIICCYVNNIKHT